MRFSPVVAILYAVAGASASAIQYRDCGADNVLRALRNPANSASASGFCFTYIQSTSVTTVTATAVVVSSTSTTLPVAAATETDTETDTATVSSTFTTYSANPVVISTETTFTVLPPVKRSAAGTVYPGEPTELATYPASRISSACSCFISLPPVATSTSTVTSTATSTLTSVLGPLSTSTATVDVSTTTTITTVNTLILPATSTESLSATVTIAVSQCTNVANLPTYSQPVLQIDLNLVENPVDGGVAASEEACCVGCYETKNCASFLFDISLTNHKVCFFYTVDPDSFDQLEPSSNKLCPLGQLSLSSITNLDPSVPVDTVKLGPCGSP